MPRNVIFSPTRVGRDKRYSRQQGPAGCLEVACRFNLAKPGAGRKAYAAGHIAGAYYAGLDHDLAAPVLAGGAGGRHPLPDPAALGRLARGWGINADSRVVAYDDLGGSERPVCRYPRY